MPDEWDQIVIHESFAPEPNELEYSTDLEDWHDLEYDQGFPSDESDYTGRVFIRAQTERTSAQTYADYIWMEASTEQKFAVGGNIMYLLGPDGPSMELQGYDFYRLFASQTEKSLSLTDASALVLPAQKLAPYCYGHLFKDTQLVAAPELPATELAEDCYCNMFCDCGSLEIAPVLNATKMVPWCYEAMFRRCKSLVVAPSLPATELAEGCFGSMFAECESLTEAPALPATELAEKCYSDMFGSSGITESPVLPARKLVAGCYSRMFDHCENLTSVTCLADDFSGEDAIKEWLVGVSSEGTFTKASGVTWPDGSIPAGWSVEEAPAE